MVTDLNCLPENLHKVMGTLTKPKLMLSPILPLALVTVLVILVSCSGQITYTNVTAEETKELVNRREVVLLDVRNVEEYNSGHIPDTLFIPLPELESRLNELDQSDRILLYCRSGTRSTQAAIILIENGFTHIYNMKGGITDWKALGFPITR